MGKYWWLVVKRTATDTSRLCGFDRAGLILVLSFAAGTFAHLWRFGLREAMQEVHVFISYGIMGAGSVALAIFFWSLFAAPPKIHNERSIEIDGLHKQLNNKEARQAALDRLWRLRKSGVDLRNQRITSDQYNKWYADYQVWHKEMLVEAEKISRNLHQWLETLERQPNEPVNEFSIDPGHRKVLCNFSEALRRLGLYLEGQITKE